MTDVKRINLRLFEASDMAALHVVHDAARRDELALSVGADALLSLAETYDSEGLFDGEVAVAEVAGDVRGFVAYDDKELTWLYVDPSYSRQGIGRALVRFAVERAKREMTVEVLEGNEPAKALYLSEGFAVIERKIGRLEGNENFAAAGLVLSRKPDAE
ncbi:GNAT family N-acetyltransferase [Phaeobacter inhibens]|uniref:GNAT family N-acetyltransferase n=1 Tax=Phaeobacter inhibens TaxID=221822 RepID=UPI0021A6E41D|nr:GNAT family N-acetyltransferase [Phaeobacter inhibens]UWR47018.1 GNAT family N-acetyltransferase [Phaeobacter inhibens]UWR90474.1 GNAT family N-acetyltransferase [Phaeobacter inhibens]